MISLPGIVAWLGLAIVLLQHPLSDTKPSDPFARWEKTIVALEQQQKQQGIRAGGIVFAGSSTIRLWKLAEHFPNLSLVNSGFGGSQIRDCTHFAPRIILPHKPRQIVFYAGDNDIQAGRTPKQVLADFQAFVRAIHEQLPKCQILFLSIKPSLRRWEQRDKQKQANEMIQTYCQQDDRLVFVDIVSEMLDQDGRPDPSLFVKDGLHLSPKGYQRWANRLVPHLQP